MSALETRVAEEVARMTTRKRFVKRIAQGTFAGLSLWMVSGPLAGSARGHTLNGQGHCANTSGSTTCSPPHGVYCTGCVNHGCPSGRSFTAYWGYNSACWCTLAGSTGAYSICCDCSNGNHAQDCGCRETIRPGVPA
jgi:hypothetical protein